LEATARLAQLQRTGSWTPPLSVDEFAAVKGVGFDPVGQVMGSTVDRIGMTGWGSCGLFGASGGYRPMSRSGVVGLSYQPDRTPVPTTFRAYDYQVRALYAARRRAVGRLEKECVAVGGDGVVGVELMISPFLGVSGSVEFQALGTAVRSRGRRHPTRPFMSDLTGQDFAKLLHSGWVPCGLAFGVAIGVRHEDSASRQLDRRMSCTSAEVPAHTELVHDVRKRVRSELAVDVARQGGAGVVVQAMTLRAWEQHCGQLDRTRDWCAEATIVGTSIAPFRRREPTGPPSLTVLRLDQRHDRTVSEQLTGPPCPRREGL